MTFSFNNNVVTYGQWQRDTFLGDISLLPPFEIDDPTAIYSTDKKHVENMNSPKHSLES